MVSVNHGFALSNPALVSALFKKSSSNACWPILACSGTVHIVAAALAGLKAIPRPGFRLAKAGVMLLDLQPDSIQQGELDLKADEPPDRSRLMSALDGWNERYGRGTVLMASAGLAGDRRT